MTDLEALRNTHGRLPAVMRSRSSILITLDQEGTVLLWNSGAEKCFARSEEQVMGLPFRHCGIAWDWDRVAQVAPRGVSEHARRLVMSYRRPDGSIGVLAMQLLPQFGPDGELSGCLWLGSDTGETAGRRQAPPAGGKPEPAPAPAADPPAEQPSGQRPAASGMRPATSGQRPATSDQRPAASGQRPAASDQRPAASDQPPAPSGQPPATSGQRSPASTSARHDPVAPSGSSAAPPRAAGPSTPKLQPPPPAASASTRSFAPVPIGTLRSPGAKPTEAATTTADPSRQFPVHLSFLDSHLVANGDDLSQWRILHAKESRLDASGMEVLFTLSRRYPGHGIITRRVLIAAGELVHIQDA